MDTLNPSKSTAMMQVCIKIYALDKLRVTCSKDLIYKVHAHYMHTHRHTQIHTHRHTSHLALNSLVDTHTTTSDYRKDNMQVVFEHPVIIGMLPLISITLVDLTLMNDSH